MAYEQRDNTGALFRNNDRTEGTQLEYRGNIKVGGTEYWLSAWVKISQAGMKYFSLSIKPKNADAAKPKNASRAEEMDDAIPF